MMKENITKNIKVTPSDVKNYYRSIPPDSLPLINSEVEISQIVKQPPVSPEEKLRVRTRLAELRAEVINGKSFTALAALYSEDPGSARSGGELGMVGRGELYPEFEAVAFSLEKGQVSDIVETKAGYHIIQGIERRGDYVNVRHILLVPKAQAEDNIKARSDLENVASLIRMDSLSFERAASIHSDDPSKNSGGILVNPMTGTSKFETSQLDPSIFFVIDKMDVGEISEPVVMRTQEGQQAYRIMKLISRTKPHRANLEEDYNRLQEWATEKKNEEAIQKWINKKTANTYVSISGNFDFCSFTFKWEQ
jgi:peptidyl-prolyl cis-trans isomerase SurA